MKILLITICLFILNSWNCYAVEKKHPAKIHHPTKIPHPAKINTKDIHWDYSGIKGPENWGKIDKAFLLCSEGKNQSPVNLTGFVKTKLKDIDFNYKTDAEELINDGHTIKVNYEKGSYIVIDNIIFELRQIRFHAPSENLLNGKSYPMEGHLIHMDKHGNLAIIAVMFVEGKGNELIKSLWMQIPKASGEKSVLTEKLNVDGLLPRKRNYFRFNGSLTTPPCTEGVRWFVLKNAITISKEQIKSFKDIIKNNNNRPIQPINARVILE